jgi:upstream activation factor subunit UAF30
MARTKKSESTPAPVTVEKAPSTKSAKSESKKSPASTPKKVISDTVVPKNDVVSEVPPEDTVTQDTPLSTEFVNIMTQAQALAHQLSTLRASLRSLEKKASRELKMATKAGKKHKRAKGNRQPSGFVKPTQISPELAAFLGKDKGVEMARTEVTKEINAYIRTNSLQDPKNGRHIIPDAKLVSLLKLKSDDELTYFNLQKFMSPHFAKTTPVKA